MRRTLFALLVLLALMETSCSMITYFVVANVSDVPITVIYEAKPIKNIHTGKMKCLELNKPSTVKASKIGRWFEPEWRELEPNEFDYDVDTCSARIVIPPGMAVRIASEINYTEHKGGRDEIYELEAFTLQSPTGLIHYEGAEVLDGFEKISNGLYVLYYE